MWIHISHQIPSIQLQNPELLVKLGFVEVWLSELNSNGAKYLKFHVQIKSKNFSKEVVYRIFKQLWLLAPFTVLCTFSSCSLHRQVHQHQRSVYCKDGELLFYSDSQLVRNVLINVFDFTIEYNTFYRSIFFSYHVDTTYCFTIS